MGKFKVGDRVRFVQAYSGIIKGAETTVRSLDHKGLPILAFDPPSDDFGWSCEILEVIKSSPSGTETLRDRFAMSAVSAIIEVCRSDNRNDTAEETYPEYVARKSYEIASAMMAERERAK